MRCAVITRRFTPRAVRRPAETRWSTHRDRRPRSKAVPDGVTVELDFVERVAAPFPLAVDRVIILGVPGADWGLLFRWTNEVIGKEDPEYRQPGESPGRTDEAGAARSTAYFEAARRRSAGASLQDDLVSELHPRRASTACRSARSSSFRTASFSSRPETRPRATPSAAVCSPSANTPLVRVGERLRADPDLLPDAVEEILRWVSPISHFTRVATEDCEVGGMPIAAGDQLALYFASANRDEELYDDPFAFRIDRNPNPYLGASASARHFCVGKPTSQARRDRDDLPAHLLARLESFELAGTVVRLESAVTGSSTRLPLRFHRAAPPCRYTGRRRSNHGAPTARAAPASKSRRSATAVGRSAAATATSRRPSSSAPSGVRSTSASTASTPPRATACGAPGQARSAQALGKRRDERVHRDEVRHELSRQAEHARQQP